MATTLHTMASELSRVHDRKSFALAFKLLRIRNRFDSARSLSAAARLHPSHVAAIESGRVLPNWVTLRKLADAFSLSSPERRELCRALDRVRQPQDVRVLLDYENRNQL